MSKKTQKDSSVSPGEPASDKPPRVRLPAILASLAVAALTSAISAAAETPQRTAPRLAEGRSEYRQPPLTIECRARLTQPSGYNILVASDTKQSGMHWEIFSMAGSGTLTAYLPGFEPDHIRTSRQICDGAWHTIAMIYEAERIRLFVDGKLVADEAVRAKSSKAVPGPLAFGRLAEGGLGCEGEIEWVHIRRGVHLPPAADITENNLGEPRAVDRQTVGFWQFTSGTNGVSDASPLNNPARSAPLIVAPPAASQGPVPPDGPNCEPAIEGYRTALIDRSPDVAYLGVMIDSEGQLFVGAREAVLVYEPDGRGGFLPRREICRFPPDSLVLGLEWRGDDLYALTANALYLLPEGRVRREGVEPRRLLWGLPLDLHVSFHCLAWGPEGDLYLSHGDPLLNYGDFNRPDHWGHWTIHAQPEGTRLPYTGVGAVLRVRPDGSRPQVVAGGLRGPVGLAFDDEWNLFTNDNDHESRADLYAPARLLHVTPHIDFGWPRGWMASLSPDRADLIEPLTASLGRGVPCALAYLDGSRDGQRGSLLMARWDQMSVNRYPLEPHGATFRTKEQSFVAGRELARPVGVAAAPDGRVFLTQLYLSGNVWSPHCYSDLVLMKPADQPASGLAGEPYSVTTVGEAKLWSELSSASWQRRLWAHQELVRRGGAIADQALARMGMPEELVGPAGNHLPWLAAARRSDADKHALEAVTDNEPSTARLQAIRALVECFPPDESDPKNDLRFAALLDDADPRVRLAALQAFFRSGSSPAARHLPVAAVARLAADSDDYLRQTAARLLAERASLDELAALLAAGGQSRRAAVLAIGLRLTAPPCDFVPPDDLPLNYTSPNASFELTFADTDRPVDLRASGRTGSFTAAEWWKHCPPTPERRRLADLLVAVMDHPTIAAAQAGDQTASDQDDAVRLQAAYFLSLLSDDDIEPRIARARREVAVRRLSVFGWRNVSAAWMLGPFDSAAADSVRPENGPIDLAAGYVSADGPLSWQVSQARAGKLAAAADRRDPGKTTDQSVIYLHFKLQSATRQHALLEVSGARQAALWHNGRPAAEPTAPCLLALQPGGNELLIRAEEADAGGLRAQFRASQAVTDMLPERVDSVQLAARLRQAAGGEVPAELLEIDWSGPIEGDAARGRQLFSTIGCAKCHGITAEQPGGGAPNLADARRRFTAAYLVESVLLPSKQIAEPFRSTVLSLESGQVVTGLVVNETADSLELLLPDATRRRISADEIEERGVGRVSPMPSGLIKTPQELRDLLAYLLSDRPTP